MAVEVTKDEVKRLSPKERILKERGMLQRQPAPKRHKILQPAIKVTVAATSKTPLMRYLETKYGKAIEDMLVSGSLSIVAKQLGGEVDTSTLSRWIKRFKLRYSEGNLPSCTDCKQYGLACEQGACYVLINLELYDLLPIKREEVLK